MERDTYTQFLGERGKAMEMVLAVEMREDVEEGMGRKAWAADVSREFNDIQMKERKR